MTVERAIELQEQSWNLEAEGKLDEASCACREALRLMERAEGADSPDVANLLNDLAEIEQERENFADALALAERARSVEDGLGERFTGETASQIRIRTLAIAGAIRRIQGDYAQAEGGMKEALAISVAEWGAASEEAAEARNNLAVLYKYWGRFDDGLRLYTEALASILPIHGEESLASATIHHNIGGILHARGDFAAAEEPARKAWEISRRLLGEDHPQTMLDAAAYAGVLDGLERYDESEPIYRRALAVFERAYGPEHYEVAATLHNLAAVLAARGHHPEAEEHYRRVLAIKGKLLGAGSPDVALTRNNLGKLLTDMGRPAEALPLLEAAVAVLEGRLPPGHPHLSIARENLRNATRP
ncbi:MAG: tetratricopeptide repeat protein [Terriglobales bacterium]